MNKANLHILVAILIEIWIVWSSIEFIGLWGIVPALFCGFWIGGWAGYYYDRLS